MTVAAKKIKTYAFSIYNQNIVHAQLATGSASWVVERDITIIGVHVDNVVEVTAGELAEVGGFRCNTAISRAAQFGLPGQLVVVSNYNLWSAAGDAGNTAAQETIMFPDGYAVDVDDGESVIFLVSGKSLQAAVDTQHQQHTGIVYYVDR